MNKPHKQTDSSLTGSFLVGGGEMGKLVRTKDWSATPLGAIETWPTSLRTAVSLVLNSNFPISLAWGPNHTQIYNDGYWPICAEKHPLSMGQDFSVCWASAFPVIGEAFNSALAGKTAFLEDQRMFLDRLGYLEETFFTFSFSPIRDEYGAVAGLFHPVTETTSKMVGQRRTRLLRDLTAIGLRAQTLDEALELSAQTLAEDALDVPFVLFYKIDKDQRTARLAAHAGLEPDGAASPVNVDLISDGAGWPMAQIVATGTAVALDDLRVRFPGLVCGPYPEPLASARIFPILPHGHLQPIGLMIVGASTRRPMNDVHITFFELLYTTVNNVVASALAITEERRRVEALAEIDRAKTAFFSNVSHEFRTPITLMLGPLEDELAECTNPLPEPRHQRLEMVHRNTLRLLKLVNNLLDFSLIEAGRAKARYQATDLAESTKELASTFRSAIEKAGLTLEVDCPALPEPIFVDYEMWEKIVLNLLSNAFKHTFEGSVRLSLRWCGDHVELDVTDTGIGIPAEEIPHLFERFHRVQGARSRTHEGTGIGLALVQELVGLHDGTVRANSVQGKGSTFTVTLKTGCAHLPTENILVATASDARTRNKAAYVDQALQWIPVEPVVPAPINKTLATADRARIIWADDNADMRNYVYRLLGEYYDVTAVSNGREAVAVALARPPDLVLTDIMMPVLDGYGVLRELRADERTRHIPVIFLSARAGEEESISGLEMGADDYLVKPFIARELLARVRTHLELAKLRQDWAVEQERYANLMRSEAMLREREWEFHSLAEAMPQIVWVARPDGWTIYLNQQWVEYTGLTLEESYGQGWIMSFHPDDQRRAREAWQRATHHYDTYSLECRLRRVDGIYRWWLIRGVPFRNESDEIIKWFGTCTDIEDIKQAEADLRYRENQLRFITDHVSILIAHCDHEKRYKFVNQPYADFFGLQPSEIIGKHPQEILGKKIYLQAKPYMDTALSGQTTGYELELTTTPHGLLVVSVKYAPEFDAMGRVVGFVAAISNITELKRAEHQIRIAATAFESHEGIIITDANATILNVNQSFSKITGYAAEEVIGKNPRILSSGKHDKAFYEVMWERLNQEGKWEGEIWSRRKDGVVYLERLSITAVRDEKGLLTNYVGNLSDISRSKAAEKEIELLAFYDPLTGLPNRRLLTDRLNQAFISSARSEQSVALLFLDLDNFKIINDTLGHRIGDLLLQEVAARILGQVREEDTVARLGGDEFVVMLEHLSEQALEAAAQAQFLANKILSAISQVYLLESHQYHCTSSIGINLLTGQQIEVDRFMQQADIAMYQAKNDGRNTLRFYDQKMQDAITLRASLERELRVAIDREQFQLYYQVQMDSFGHPYGAEVLIRWIHPERGLISPAQFIPLAEENNLILAIGKWVLEKACAQIKTWEQNALTSSLSLSVNVSAKQFRQVDFVEQVQTTVLRHGINPCKLKLEITESMLVENIEDIVIIMNKLNGMGIRFELDDFGTGYSSLQYLKNLPLYQLKIDQSFVHDITTNRNDDAIVCTIIAMAQSLGLEVIAEGVETEDQRQYLFDRGCMYYQGYLFGKPMPIDEFEVLLGKS